MSRVMAMSLIAMLLSLRESSGAHPAAARGVVTVGAAVVLGGILGPP